MKELYLVKHGHSDMFTGVGKDKDTPLSAMGYRIISLLGNQLLQSEAKPDLILTSPAQRASMTANLLARALHIKQTQIKSKDELYLNSYNECINLISKTNDSCERLMVISHEPAITDLFNNFLDPPLINVPAASALLVTLLTDSWNDIKIAPKEFRCLIMSGINVKQSAYHELSDNHYIYDL